jgi:hypothetical protein
MTVHAKNARDSRRHTQCIQTLFGWKAPSVLLQLSVLPARYVLASTPFRVSAVPEVRVFAPDYLLWSSAVPAPSPAFLGIPPGIGASTGDPATSQYVLAWFGSGGVLHTATSAGAVSWSNDTTHGTFSVDQKSRPSIVYNYDTNAWIVAFRQSNDTVVVQRVAPSDSSPFYSAIRQHDVRAGIGLLEPSIASCIPSWQSPFCNDVT